MTPTQIESKTQRGPGTEAGARVGSDTRVLVGGRGEREGMRLGHRPGLDGLRGVAVLLVVVAHLGGGVQPANRSTFGFLRESGGGVVGVQLFFVLSGFLITSLLLEERARTGRIDVRAFYVRRARRLLPALLCICVVHLVVIAVASPERMGLAVGTVARSLLYVQNFSALIPFETDVYLGHAWSLAVEEQFYAVWPILFLGAAALAGRRAVAMTAVLVIVATIGARVLVDDPYLTYTGLRWDALGLGCLLATMPSWRPQRSLVVASAVLFGLFTVSMPNPNPDWVYVVTAGAAGVMVMAALDAQGWLSHSWLRHIGTISYGLYLWHVYIVRAGFHPVLTILLFVAAAELSWRFIERPFLRVQPRSEPVR